MADMVNITRSGPEVMLDNLDYDAMPNEARIIDPALKTRTMSADTVRTYGIVFGAGYIGIVAIAAALRWTSCWDFQDGTLQCLGANAFFWTMAAIFPVLSVFSFLAYSIWSRVTTTATINARAGVSRDQWGNPVAVQLLENIDLQTYVNMFTSNLQASVLKAPHQTLPKGLNAYSTHNVSTNNAPTAQPLALTDSSINVGPLPVNEWLDYIDTRAHVMLAAETGGGKSTTAKAILAQRIEAGDDVLVIDPHASEWFNLTSYGGGENWAEVEEYMRHIITEYDKRQAERQRYKAETGKELETSHFRRITVLLDEANNAKIAFDALYSGKESKNSPWEPFVKVLGSGARKVNISVIVLVQSANVEDLGISGSMRNNFTRICLDSRTIKLMINMEEQDPARKKALHAEMKNHRYPAVALIGSEVFLLSRDGLNEIDTPNTTGSEWLPPAEFSSVRPSGVIEEAEITPILTSTAQTDGRTKPEWTDGAKVFYLSDLIQQGYTREIIRQNNMTPFEWAQELYTEANKRVKAQREA